MATEYEFTTPFCGVVRLIYHGANVREDQLKSFVANPNINRQVAYPSKKCFDVRIVDTKDAHKGFGGGKIPAALDINDLGTQS